MKRAGWVLVLMSLTGCLEPGELSNPNEIYAAVAAQNSGTSGGGMGGAGGAGMGGGGMGGSSGMGGSAGAMPGECGDVLATLITPTCAVGFCHDTEAMASLDLEADGLGMRLIGTPGAGDCKDYSIINATSPEESLLYTKLDDEPPCGSPMPLVGEKFTDAQKACVLEFIEQVVAEQ